MQQYANPSFPGAFSGLENFYRNLKTTKSKKTVRKELGETYALHYPLIKKFPRNKFIANGIDSVWQADLVDMKAFSRKNEGFSYILTVIDVFSKYAWAIPLKNKTGTEVTNAFRSIFEERIPKKIHVDKGKEFHNKILKSLLNKHDIALYSTESTMKASIIERFNRTLKEKMWRVFTFLNKQIYIDSLPGLVDNYNNSFHRTIKHKPSAVSKLNEYDVWLNLYGCTNSSINITYNQNDLVRISRKKYIFDKGYTHNWSKEIFKIKKVIPVDPPKYILQDSKGQEVVGRFYSKELQQV